MGKDTTKASNKSNKGSLKLNNPKKKKIKSRLNENSVDINVETEEFKWDNKTIRIDAPTLWLLYELIDKHIDKQYMQIEKIRLVHGGILVKIMMQNMDQRTMFWDWAAIQEQQIKMNKENYQKKIKNLESAWGVFKEDPEDDTIGEIKKQE